MKTIGFKIRFEENKNVYIYGYCEIPDGTENDPEWFYYDQNGFVVPQQFIHHEGVGISQIGAADEQMHEIEEFENELLNFCDFVDETIVFADENENETYKKGNLILCINPDD